MTEKNTLVMKFGGTSVGSLEGLQQVLEIVRQAKQDWQNVLVVSSAFSRVTDALLDSARQAAKGNQEPFLQTVDMLTLRHHRAVEHYSISDQEQVNANLDDLIKYFQHLVKAIGVLGEATPRALDAVVGLGERLAVRVIAAVLRSQGIPAQAVDACALIVTDDNYQAAIPQMEPTRQLSCQFLNPLFGTGGNRFYRSNSGRSINYIGPGWIRLFSGHFRSSIGC